MEDKEDSKSMTVFYTNLIHFLENEATLLINNTDENKGYITFDFNIKVLYDKNINEKEMNIMRETPIIYISSNGKRYCEARMIYIRDRAKKMKKRDGTGYFKYFVLFNDETIAVNRDKDNIPKNVLRFHLCKEEEELVMNWKDVYWAIDYHTKFVENIKIVKKQKLGPKLIPFFMEEDGKKILKCCFLIKDDNATMKGTFCYGLRPDENEFPII